MVNFLKRLFGFFSQDLAIDLGTANTLIMAKDTEKVLINEPSVIAVKVNKFGQEKFLAVGDKAKKMLGKTPASIKAIRPLKDGVIADFHAAEMMIEAFIKQTNGGKKLSSPRVVICVPYGLTQVERKAVKESALNAGVRSVHLIEEPMAAALGAGIDVKAPEGSLVVDIGGGTTEIGVTSLGGLVISKSIRVAGDKMDLAIVDYMKKEKELLIGERTAERLKIEIGTAIELSEPLKTRITGRNAHKGNIQECDITSEDIRKAIAQPLNQIVEALRSVLEETPPELAADIGTRGIALTGGGALIKGIDKFIQQNVEVPVYIAEDPLLAVAKGARKALDQLDLIQETSYED